MTDIQVRSGCARLMAGAFLCLIGLSGCASLVPQTMGLRDSWPQGVATHTEIRDVPFFPQEAYQCGPAALATTLIHAGTPVTQEALVERVYLPGREGSLQVEMLAAPRRYGKVSYQLAPRFDDLLREVAAGNPVIVLQDTGVGPIVRWHYAVVVGFDYPAGELYLRSGETRRLAMPFTVFEYSWRKSGYWAMVTLSPDRIPATAIENFYLAAVSAMDRVGEARAAQTAYATFLDRWPDSIGASIGLANLHYARGELAEAEVILRRVFARHPDSVVVANNLALVLSDMGRNDDALALVAWAAQADDTPVSTAVRDTHRLILDRLGRKP
jgi:hypothetical protein